MRMPRNRHIMESCQKTQRLSLIGGEKEVVRALTAARQRSREPSRETEIRSTIRDWQKPFSSSFSEWITFVVANRPNPRYRCTIFLDGGHRSRAGAPKRAMHAGDGRHTPRGGVQRQPATGRQRGNRQTAFHNGTSGSLGGPLPPVGALRALELR